MINLKKIHGTCAESFHTAFPKIFGRVPTSKEQRMFMRANDRELLEKLFKYHIDQQIARAHIVIEKSGPGFCFIPRDSGFFSAINYFIGSIMTGQRVYPYFNKERFLQVHGGVCQHFCYWGEGENSWFEFFEPVKFYPGDEEHVSGKFKAYPRIFGEISGGEFRLTHLRRMLFEDKDIFNRWRASVNSVVRRYITVRPDISDSIDTWWQTNGGENVIGVHYRHPSHYVECGYIYMRQYIAAIDNILLACPAAKIFVATDTEFAIVMLTYKYGKDKIIFLQDVNRLTCDNILEWAFDNCKEGAVRDEMAFVNGRGYQLHNKSCENKNENGVTLGRDILKEVLCLAKCKWMIHPISNVSLAASYFNPIMETYLITQEESGTYQ